MTGSSLILACDDEGQDFDKSQEWIKDSEKRQTIFHRECAGNSVSGRAPCRPDDWEW